MTSKALTNWQTDRAIRLDRLEVAHGAVGGRLLAGGLSRALVLQLTAEFQGFARDLHDEASRALATALAQGDPERRERLRTLTCTHAGWTGATPARTHWTRTSGCSASSCGIGSGAVTQPGLGSGMTGSRC
jgi:hypothetical protein